MAVRGEEEKKGKEEEERGQNCKDMRKEVIGRNKDMVRTL